MYSWQSSTAFTTGMTRFRRVLVALMQCFFVRALLSLLRLCRESMRMGPDKRDDEKGQSPMVRAVCMETISKSEYELYDSCNHDSDRPQPHFPSTAVALKDIMDDATRILPKLGYLYENLNSWLVAFQKA